MKGLPIHVTPTFPLGQIVATTGAIAALENAGETVDPYLRRHAARDWGDVSDEDRRSNDEGVDGEDTLHSAYRLTDGQKLWIITEWDRSVTTVLLPDDY